MGGRAGCGTRALVARFGVLASLEGSVSPSSHRHLAVISPSSHRHLAVISPSSPVSLLWRVACGVWRVACGVCAVYHELAMGIGCGWSCSWVSS